MAKFQKLPTKQINGYPCSQPHLIKEGSLVKRKIDSKKTYVRSCYERSMGKYLLQSYDDISDFIYVSRSAFLFTDWQTNDL